jgi:hypothetical protein
MVTTSAKLRTSMGHALDAAKYIQEGNIDLALDRLDSAIAILSPEPTGERQFDYDHQAWVLDGIYQDCAHKASASGHCCWARAHRGERAPNIH